MEKLAIDQLSALSHPQRMAIFRLLMRRYPDRLPAGEIAQALGLKASTLSGYLAQLAQSGLIGAQRQGTSLLYAADMPRAEGLADYLFADCLRARTPMLDAPLTPRPVRNVLFLCSGNSARSLMAEALLRDRAGDRFEVFSAGTAPRDAPHPLALDLLASRGHDTDSLWSKPADLFRADDAPRMDVVISVCDLAANEDTPAWAGHPLSAHWAVPDPVPAGQPAAFMDAYQRLERRIDALCTLDFTTTRRAVQAGLDSIARTVS